MVWYNWFVNWWFIGIYDVDCSSFNRWSWMVLEGNIFPNGIGISNNTTLKCALIAQYYGW